MKIRFVETRDFNGNKIWKVEKKFLGIFWENYCEPFDTEFKTYNDALLFWSKVNYISRTKFVCSYHNDANSKEI